MGEKPATVPTGIVEEIKSRETQERLIELDPNTLYEPGDSLEITAGTLSRQVGNFIRVDTDQRIVMLLQLLGRKQGFVSKRKVSNLRLRCMALLSDSSYKSPMLWMIAAFGLIAALSYFLTGATLKFLQRRAILDHPNERSSHAAPIPRGGGLPVVTTIPLWLIPLENRQSVPSELFSSAQLTLAAISWLDDLKPRSPAIRLAVQLMAVGLGVYSFSTEQPLFGDVLPRWLEFGIVGIGWLWFVNLFNMDGIDGISSAQTITVCLGLIVTILEKAACTDLVSSRAVRLLCRVRPLELTAGENFLSDIGSVTVGFWAGSCFSSSMLDTPFSAFILPLYYLTDATITLLRRGARSRKVWQSAPAEHFYQRAISLAKATPA